MVLVVVAIIVVVVVFVVVYSNVNTQTNKNNTNNNTEKPSDCVVMALLDITMQLQRGTRFVSDFVEIFRWHVCSSYSDF